MLYNIMIHLSEQSTFLRLCIVFAFGYFSASGMLISNLFKTLMKVNQSPEYRAQDLYNPNPYPEPQPSAQPSHFTFGSKNIENINPYRRIQVIISILLVVLTTLWVQITMQRHAPFIRTAQCYFNEILFLHDSQDIYEGDDVIYWRNGETYDFSQMQAIFTRWSSTMSNLNQASLFTIPTNYTKIDEDDLDVDMLIIYKYDVPTRYERLQTINCSLEEMNATFTKTLLNRSFYEHLWKVQISVTTPIVYRKEIVLMKLLFSGQIYFSSLMQYKLDVNFVDEKQQQINAANGYNDGNLGIRKLNNDHDMELSMPFLRWGILGLFVIVTCLEYRFLVQKSNYIDDKLEKKMKEEDRIEKLLEKIDEGVKRPRDSIDDVSIHLLEDVQEDKNNKNIEKRKKYTYRLPFGKRLKKIGFYYVFELAISLCAFFGYFIAHNGTICFFAWIKILIYLAETKNRLMFGFLYEQALPIYLKLQLNVFLFMTAFVLFNMLVLTISVKFQTVELAYFQYLFNYFQYGIYQNFQFAFAPYGRLVQFAYFLQLLLLLYVGNNILLSVLASQVSKHSMLTGVQQMIDQMKIQCPECGTDFERKKAGKAVLKNNQKQKLVSKLMMDLQFQKSRVHSQMTSNHEQSDINIVIKSPKLSPYFPRKNQKKKEEEQYLSPQLEQRKLKKKLQTMQKKVSGDQYTQSKIAAVQQLKTRVKKDSKKFHIELQDSNIGMTKNQQFSKEVKNKIDILYKTIDDFRQLSRSASSRTIPLNQNQVHTQVLNKILAKIQKVKEEHDLDRK